MGQRYAMKPGWDFVALGASLVLIASAGVTSDVTEQDCLDCENVLYGIRNETAQCEVHILQAQTNVSGKVMGYKQYFADVENQMKNLEPQIAELKTNLTAKYAREAELYREMHTESRVTALLEHRKEGRVQGRRQGRRRGFLRHKDKHTEDGCPAMCIAPMAQPGDTSNGGAALVDGRCTKYVSKFYGMFRYCGEGSLYEVDYSIRCTGCLEEVLVDRKMKCEDDQKDATQTLNGCKTKNATVAMWNTQRERQYKDKADVYIMRVSRQSDPLVAQIKEAVRVDASIARMEKQVQELKDNLPITTTTTTTTATTTTTTATTAFVLADSGT